MYYTSPLLMEYNADRNVKKKMKQTTTRTTTERIHGQTLNNLQHIHTQTIRCIIWYVGASTQKIIVQKHARDTAFYYLMLFYTDFFSFLYYYYYQYYYLLLDFIFFHLRSVNHCEQRDEHVHHSCILYYIYYQKSLYLTYISHPLY